MRIGLAYDLKTDSPAGVGLPDDHQEEFDSPVTIDGIAAVLRGLGHEAVLLGNGRSLLERLLRDPPDLVFNIAEGQGISRNRESRVPAVCELLNIPHTGSDVLTLAATLDKDVARRLVASEGLPVPQGRLLTLDRSLADLDLAGLPFPVIVKPAWEGSSKGIRGKCVVEDLAELADAIDFLRAHYPQPVLIEEFISGEEVTVGVLGNAEPQVLGSLRVLPLKPTERFAYSLEVKRDYANCVRYECPAKLESAVLRSLEATARGVFRVLQCRDVARTDFRIREGVPYFLEVNPLPGLNPETSDLILIARGVGWTYERLIETILSHAVSRTGATRPPPG